MRPSLLLLLLPWTYAIFVAQSSQTVVAVALPAALVTAVVLRGSAGIACAATWGLLSDALSGGSLGIDVLGFTLCSTVALNGSSPRAWRTALLITLLSALELTTAGSIRTLTSEGTWAAGQLPWEAGRTLLAALPVSFSLTYVAGWAGWLTRPDEATPAMSVHNRWSMLTN